jgi:hypothetical protein
MLKFMLKISKKKIIFKSFEMPLLIKFVFKNNHYNA